MQELKNIVLPKFLFTNCSLFIVYQFLVYDLSIIHYLLISCLRIVHSVSNSGNQKNCFAEFLVYELFIIHCLRIFCLGIVHYGQQFRNSKILFCRISFLRIVHYSLFTNFLFMNCSIYIVYGFLVYEFLFIIRIVHYGQQFRNSKILFC